MKKYLLSLAMIGGLSGMLSLPSSLAEEKKADSPPNVNAPAPEKAKQKKPLIQLAILLDTSNSMDGLIDQAKTQLWKIVNTLATTKQKGVTPDLQVALYEYGKSSIPSQEGYLRMILSFTDNLDKVSEELFALKTNGGEEYCGKVIQAAVKGLNWSQSSENFKVIFIAGNEPFTQGDTDYRIACKEAIAKGIMVNTIFCGPHQEGVNTNWEDGAKLADGKYMNIDQEMKVVHIPSPYDDQITKLGKDLNKTYLGYGRRGAEGKARQEAQDSNAKKESESGADLQRAVSKSTSMYKASTWDLVDGVKNGSVDLSKIKKEDLPEEMQKMTLEEQKSYLQKKYDERIEMQKKIRELNEKRNQFVAQKQKEQGEKNSLDKAMVEALKEQLAKKNYDVK